MRVPPEVLDEIRARVDLVDLVGAVVPLKRAGERWKGLCPFHQEKTPSFTVHPKLNLFHCFGCRAGGDAFEFLRRHDRLEFPEAVRILAERAGVPLPGQEGAREAGARDGLLALMEWAARRFEAWLWEGPAAERARAYLEGRGIDRETAGAFRLGYAPEGWDHLLGAARKDGHPVEALLGAGLVLPRQNASGHYDRFRGRLIFPIADTQGRVIALGGRALAGEEPKYLNSPETPLYQKGQTLYALHRARERMTETRRALLVEGYVDCLMAHQFGFSEAVAVLGTALTPPQLGLLRRYADEAILFFDADRAGQEAARRAEDLLERSADPQWWALSRRPDTLARRGLRLRVATLPAGHDPDTFLRAEGREALEAACRAARPLLLFALDRVLSEEDTTSQRGRVTGSARVALMLSKVQDADEAIELGREAGRRLGVDASDLWLQAQRLAEAARPATPTPATSPSPEDVTWFERDLCQLVLHAPEARVALLPLIDSAGIVHTAVRAILAALRDEPALAPEALLQRLPDDATRALLARWLVEEREWPDLAAEVALRRRRLERRQAQRRVREISRTVAESEATGAAADFNSLHAAIGQETPRIRADAGGSP
ncbi:MAG TPA: DNA primase [Methylomirabilota bacterium]|jgi:DNA primase